MLFVMNPFAGQRRARRYLADILSIFNRADYQVMVHMTAGRGDATQVVEKMAPEMDVVVCCGGDGTFNETLSGILHSGVDMPIGYIPAGSTNDFAASLKLPTKILDAARLIVEGEPRLYDAGLFGERHFAYVASFGAFTRASYSTPQNVKNALGHLAYLLEGTRELSQIKKEHMKIELEDGVVIEDDFLFGTVSNSTSLGGILTLDPKQVDMTDGKFEILLIRAPRDLSELTECIKALTSKKYNCRMITFCTTTSAQITTREDMDWTLDGEWEPGHDTVEIRNLHHAFRLIQKG